MSGDKLKQNHVFVKNNVGSLALHKAKQEIRGKKMDEVDEYYSVKEIMTNYSIDIKTKVNMVRTILFKNERKNVMEVLEKNFVHGYMQNDIGKVIHSKHCRYCKVLKDLKELEEKQ